MMLSVALFGIGLAIAIPAADDYYTRQDVSEGLLLALKARDAVHTSFTTTGPADMSSTAVTGWTPPAPTELVSGISISASGVITVLYTAHVVEAERNRIDIVPVADGKSLDLRDPANRGRKISWECGSRAGKTTVQPRYRPETCR